MDIQIICSSSHVRVIEMRMQVLFVRAGKKQISKSTEN